MGREAKINQKAFEFLSGEEPAVNEQTVRSRRQQQAFHPARKAKGLPQIEGAPAMRDSSFPLG